ncbi:uncharacterized protein Dwil_GK27151 [Drosophila willistoni]|uniref:F-box domain-containing protein n=1 Tax=Drosophila willistoni TaxID=7260 RepID=A0A0Q9X047_DROWI|nr:uncharacterized protein Dwil_GK27151 [Drosophila willistoni]
MAHASGIEYGIGILASDSWNQPQFIEDPQNDSEEAYILRIPDDCLLRIISYLSLTDRLHFQRTCKRFRAVYELHTRCLHNAYIDDADIDELTKLTNLESIALGGCHSITDYSMMRLLLQCPKLQDVHLKKCSKITDELVYNIGLPPRI